MGSRPKALDAIEVRVGAAASPALVATTAQMLEDVVRAAGGDPNSSHFTVVILNWAMRSELRCWNLESRRSIDRIARVVRNPLEAAQEMPGAQPIAASLAKWSAELAKSPDVTIRRKGVRYKRRIDNAFVEAMDAAARLPPTRVLRRTATMTVETAVLQVGRTSPSSVHPKALILIGGKARQLQIYDEEEKSFAEAMIARKPVRVIIEAPLVEHYDGRVDFEWKNAVAIRVDSYRPLSGREFLHGAREISRETSDALLDTLGLWD